MREKLESIQKNDEEQKHEKTDLTSSEQNELLDKAGCEGGGAVHQDDPDVAKVLKSEEVEDEEGEDLLKGLFTPTDEEVAEGPLRRYCLLAC